jgi:phosphomannomutase/phosphoglucomutase
MSAATMLNLVTERNKPLSALIAELPAFTMYQEKRKTRRTAEIIIHMKEYFKDCPTDVRDGIRITCGGAWALIRPSGTEPIIRVYTESKNSAEAKQLMDEILGEMSRYLE